MVIVKHEASFTLSWHGRVPTNKEAPAPESAAAHMDEPNAFWRNVWWPDETKTKLFAHSEKKWVWRSKSEGFKANNTVPNMVV